jgi:thiol-disulfide isomerase/thioredoxin
MSFERKRAMVLALLAAVAFAMCVSTVGAAQQQAPSTSRPAQVAQAETAKSTSSKPVPPKPPSELEELQQAIDTASNDRAALVRNLEQFLKKYPESRQRPQIYRALVEASLQLRDNARATDYAERIVAMAPEDLSMTLLAIQLLERSGDEAALRRAVNYSNRVLDHVDAASHNEKSPKVSQAEWDAQQKNQRVNILDLRGRLYLKLRDNASAKKDFEASMALVPTSQAAEQLGEIAELSKDVNGATKAYAQAFVLSGSGQDGVQRRELRQKLGNVWRLAHGSDAGLGDFLLHTYDESIVAQSSQPKRNAAAKEPYDFSLRNVGDGSPYLLASQKGKIVVVNFWATWCGPCREMEPHFEHVAAQFQSSGDIVFIAASCDEDETLVPAYLQEVRPRTIVVFADGLDHLLAVNSLPTIVVLDRTGKIAYRSEGFDPDGVEAELSGALRRVLSGDAPSAGDAAHGVKSGL